MFRLIQLYTVSMQGTSTIFIDHLPTCYVFRKSTYYAGIKIFNNLPSCLRSLVIEKTQFKVTLKRYLSAHLPLYSVDEFVLPKITDNLCKICDIAV